MDGVRIAFGILCTDFDWNGGGLVVKVRGWN